jgi:recombination protein RecT
MAQGAGAIARTNNQRGDMTTQNRATFKDLMHRHGKQLQKIAAKNMDMTALYRVFLNQCDKNPKLWQCTIESVMDAFQKAAETGLYPGTAQEFADLIPMWDGEAKCFKAEYWVRYKGMEELFRLSGVGAHIRANAVYEGDEFEVDMGTGDYLRHRPRFGSRDDSQITHFYAIAIFKDGTKVFDVMTRQEVEVTRDASPSKGKSPSWRNRFPEMGKKTIIKRLAKHLPQSARLQRALNAEDKPSPEDVMDATWEQDDALLRALPAGEDPTPEEESVDEHTGGEPLTMEAQVSN